MDFVKILLDSLCEKDLFGGFVGGGWERSEVESWSDQVSLWEVVFGHRLVKRGGLFFAFSRMTNAGELTLTR